MRTWREFLNEESANGVVEVILIVVVLISLVAIFKTQITAVINAALKKISENAKKI